MRDCEYLGVFSHSRRPCSRWEVRDNRTSMGHPHPLRIEPGLGLITVGAGLSPGSPLSSYGRLAEADGTKPFDSSFPQPGRLAADAECISH